MARAWIPAKGSKGEPDQGFCARVSHPGFPGFLGDAESGMANVDGVQRVRGALKSLKVSRVRLRRRCLAVDT